MIALFFLIRSLDVGGAERQLIELIRGMDKTKFRITVATFYDGGVLRTELAAIPGVKTISLGKSGRWELFSFFRRLMQAVHVERVDIIHGYLDVANIFAWFAGRLSGAKVIFGIRAAFIDFSRYDWTARATHQLANWLARSANGVIINSHAGLAYHRANRFEQANTAVIPNGIDTQIYRREPALGLPLRAEWGVSPNQKLIGLVGRLDPLKDHHTFLQAAAQLGQQAQFVCVGDGPAEYRRSLQQFAEQTGARNVLWAGARRDMPSVYNALDLLALSSRGEGFPNVVAEAMACEIPCVVTDVGDARQIVGETGVIVPPGDAQALAEGLRQLLLLSDEERKALGRRARQQIVDKFATEKMVAATESFLMDLLKR